MLVLPSKCVEFRALECIETGPCGIAGYIQESHGADECMASIDGPGVEGDVPHVVLVVPVGRCNRHSKLEVRPEAELVDHLFQVLLELGLLGVGTGPFM